MQKAMLLAMLLAVSAFAFCEPAPGKPLARPTAGQVEWHDMEMEMFLCFDPCTWQNNEYDDHSTPLDKINPDRLDTDQWARVAVSMGAKQILFVAKHTGGFCWWQTDTTDYGVKETPWRGGKGDVMRDLSESCRKAGLKLGVYLSPADDHYGAKGGGKCEVPEKQAVYDKVYRQQLTELLTRYGDISEVWYDGGLVIEAGDILKEHAAKAQIFQGKFATIRWVGNEEGHAPYPAWNAVSREAWQRGATAADGDPNGEVWLPNEVDTVNVFPHFWFWNNKPKRRLLTLDKLMDCYYKSVGHGAVLLLNQTPDTTGLIPEADARQAAAFGAEVQRRFGRSLAETSGTGPELVLDLGKPTPVDHAIIMEDIREGERIRAYVVEGRSGTEWKPLAQGTAVGHKKIDRFAASVEVSALRLRCTASEGIPVLRKLAAYHVGGSL
jgi:alpha-L-fucosidase